ncbi:MULTISPECIES: hypothetical protein [unclassified Bradyrhizobium]|uniref:hypothetical protein n=1 Tax=Bradyrhizobium sp. USDA 4541 TaxID=2817704 RepID=UPI0020A5263D|nr:hypothetical protein [Bradyrhizobium sp. USDA 4541]MCP1850256.1 hypothetical protein [Bradyrhizobium sp. USDA 4541]
MDRARNVALRAGCVQVEAQADGWWYAALLPEQARHSIPTPIRRLPVTVELSRAC